MEELKSWIRENMPVLNDTLSCASDLGRCCDILNRVTGLDIKGHDRIEETAPKFLAALKELSPAKRSYLELTVF